MLHHTIHSSSEVPCKLCLLYHSYHVVVLLPNSRACLLSGVAWIGFLDYIVIGVSLSEPHVLMWYVSCACMSVCIHLTVNTLS